jgi:hypothetical protein
MKQASELLQFYFSATTFRQSAEKLFPTTLTYQLENRISQLNNITQMVGNSSFAFDDNTLKIRTYRKFKSSYSSNIASFSKRELRALIYGLDYCENNQHSIFDDENEFAIVLNLLDTNWRDTFLEGLILFLLKNWESEKRTSLSKLSEFIIEKLRTYKGNRRTTNAFKTNIKYFDLKNGDLVLGNELALKNKPIKEATDFLSLTETWFSYSYFSKVIVAYYEQKQSELSNMVDDYENALDFHKNSNTNKRIVSKFIIQANKPEYSALQDKVKHLAFKFIGDPENKSLWADFFNATVQEKSDLINARKILNEWITRQFINVFFNVCLNDDRRKLFWLMYAPQISSFKVYGPNFTKTLLKKDKRIAEYLDARFNTVYSSKDVSAFILYIGEYMIIEFSNAGFACYAYKLSSPNIPRLNIKLNSVEDLRNSSLGLAITEDTKFYYPNEEGRLRHNGSWEQKFNFWLKEKVLK